MLNRALDLPDVDWLIRSETSPNEAFDIEVTGGWVTLGFFVLATRLLTSGIQERCSPVTIPDPPGLGAQDHPTAATPPQEIAHLPQEEAPSPASESSSVTSVGSSSEESSYPSADTPPSDVTVNMSFEEPLQRIGEECRSPVEDRDSLANNLSSSEIVRLPVEMDSPVHPASASHGPFTPPPDSEPAPASITSSPESPMAPAASTSSQDGASYTQTLLDYSSNFPTLLTSDAETPSDTRDLTLLENTTSDDVHTQVEDVRPPVEPVPLSLGPSLPNLSELALASSAHTNGRTQPLPESAYPVTKAVHTPVQLERKLSESLTQRLGNNLIPASVAPTQIITIPPRDTLQAEAAVLPSTPEPPKPVGSLPTLNRTAAIPDTTVRSKTEPARSSQEPIITLTESKAILTSGVLASDGIPPLSERARSGAEVVRRPAVKPPPAPPKEPTVPIVKKPAPTRGTPVPYIIPAPSERARPQVEAPGAPVPKASAPLMPRIPSIATDGVPPTSRITLPGARAKVETPSPPVRSEVHTAPRTTLVGKQLAPLNGVPVPDIEVHSSSRSRIKSHPKKMPTPVSYRRSMAFSTQMNSQPTAQPSGLPSVRPEDHTTSGLKSNYSNSMTFYTSLIESSNLGATPEPRGGYQGYARPGVPPPSAQVSVASSVSGYTALNSNTRLVITQDPIGQSRRSTVVSGQMPPQLTALSPDKSASRPVEKPVPSSTRNRSNSASIARQDRSSEAFSHSSQARASGLAVIMEGRGAPTGSIVRSATPPIATTRVATREKVNVTTAILSQIPPNSIPRTSSIANIKHSAVQPRKSVEVTSQLAVPSSYQPVKGRQSVTSAALNSRTDTSGVAIRTETRGEFRGYSTGARVPPTSSVGGAATSTASSVWNNSSRNPSRIKTKDLISRHKQQNASDTRPPSIAQSASLSKSPTSGLSATAPLTGKPDSNRIDSGIELWDYDHQGGTHNRRRGSDLSMNGHSSPRDLGPSSALPTNSLVGAGNTNSKNYTSPSLSTKKSRASILGPPSPVVNRVHSGRRMSTPPPPQPVRSPLPSVSGSSSASPLSSTPPGRREPFINRKPQHASQSTSQSGISAQSGFSTPSRSSTPSSMSHSASIMTSTQATMFTPATSFTIPSRAPSPATEVGHKSWFRRNVIEPVKSKLGYAS